MSEALARIERRTAIPRRKWKNELSQSSEWKRKIEDERKRRSKKWQRRKKELKME
jgi:hypothetical protein